MPRTSEHNTPANRIKNFCAKLSGHDIVNIIMTYDGSGDSGDGDFLVEMLPMPLSAGNTVNPDHTLQSDLRTVHFRTALTNIMSADKSITSDDVDRFEDDVFNLLPSGWEINDGSYGCITVDVNKGTIRVEHSERYTEVSTSVREY